VKKEKGDPHPKYGKEIRKKKKKKEGKENRSDIR